MEVFVSASVKDVFLSTASVNEINRDLRRAHLELEILSAHLAIASDDARDLAEEMQRRTSPLDRLVKKAKQLEKSVNRYHRAKAECQFTLVG